MKICDRQSLVDQLRAERRRRRISQIEMDDLAGFTAGFTSKLEMRSGKPNARAITIETALKYAGALGLCLLLASSKQANPRGDKMPSLQQVAAEKGGRIAARRLGKQGRRDRARRAAHALARRMTAEQRRARSQKALAAKAAKRLARETAAPCHAFAGVLSAGPVDQPRIRAAKSSASARTVAGASE